MTDEIKPDAPKDDKKVLWWGLAGGIYIGFQVLLIVVWLVCFVAGVGGALIHLLLVLALALAVIGAVVGGIMSIRYFRKR